MTTRRATTAMITLADGRVLAPGGEIDPLLPLTGTAEVFNPTLRTWAPVQPMAHLSGFVDGLILPSGEAFVLSPGGGAETYNASGDRWSAIADLLAPHYYSLALLPNGMVLIGGGSDNRDAGAGTITSQALLFDPSDRSIRQGLPMMIPRVAHETVVLPDGTVLALGGYTTGGAATASVEKITWEPRIVTTLDPGFYVATSTARGFQDGGFWGIEATTSGPMAGGMWFGGSLPGGGADVGFGGFYLPEAQTVSGSVDFHPIGGGTFGVTLRLLDVKGQPEAAPITGGTHLAFQQALPAGFHVITLQTSVGSPPAAYGCGLSAPSLAAGAVAGGVLDPALGPAGFTAFYLPERQDVKIRLYNEQTYGPRGAGEVILTLYDSTGKVVARSGPGQ